MIYGFGWVPDHGRLPEVADEHLAMSDPAGLLRAEYCEINGQRQA